MTLRLLGRYATIVAIGLGYYAGLWFFALVVALGLIHLDIQRIWGEVALWVIGGCTVAGMVLATFTRMSFATAVALLPGPVLFVLLVAGA